MYSSIYTFLISHSNYYYFSQIKEHQNSTCLYKVSILDKYSKSRIKYRYYYSYNDSYEN